MATYSFNHWNDGDTNPLKTINVTAPLTLTATYQEVISLVTKTFQGKISAVVQAGETVTITITSPTNVVTTITALTDALGNFSQTADLAVANGYTAFAHVGEFVNPDGTGYQAADSAVQTFNVTAALLPRTITLNVS